MDSADRKKYNRTMEQIKTSYADPFSGDGRLEGKYKMEMDSMVKLVQVPKRHVPVALMKPLKEELRDLQHRGIITPVECSTDQCYCGYKEAEWKAKSLY